MDDGSTDNGPEIVAAYKDSRLKLIRQANAGPGAARNRGLAESKSPLVAFLDADDEWMPEFLETSLMVLEANPDCDITAATYFMGEKRQDATDIFWRYGMTQGPWRLSENISDHELKHAIYILHSSSTLAKRHIIEKYGGFYTANHCTLGEDYYLWLQIMLNHKIYRIMKPLWWFHTEASELGLPQKQNMAAQPFLTDIQPVRDNCPAELLPVLDRWLALFALNVAHECSYNGNPSVARDLIRRFPAMRSFYREYTKLRIKMFIPQLIPVVRYFKHLKQI